MIYCSAQQADGLNLKIILERIWDQPGPVQGFGDLICFKTSCLHKKRLFVDVLIYRINNKRDHLEAINVDDFFYVVK